MVPIAYRARAVGPLRGIDWAIPSGVSVVVGPNRVGKSTLLRLPELLGNALTENLHEAFKSVFEGVRAIRILVEAGRSWAAKHDLRVVLATQSETVLDQFRDEPSHVFVLEPQQETAPKALTELFSPEYLSQFSLGDLFAHLEFGADTSEDRTT